MKEGTTGKHPLTVSNQPIVKLYLLNSVVEVHVFPDIGVTAGGSQPGDPQSGAIPACQRGEFVEFVNIVPSNHHGGLRIGEAFYGKFFQCTRRHGE